jgi:hypothetical protein
MSKSSNSSYNKVLYWIPTIFLCGGMIGSTVLWLTVTGPPEIVKIAEKMDASNTWVFYLLPVGQVIAAIIILNRKMPAARTFAYAFAIFYNGALMLLLLNSDNVVGAVLEFGKIAVAVWAYVADRNRIAKSLPTAVNSGASVNA